MMMDTSSRSTMSDSRALYGCVCLRYLASALTFRTRRSLGLGVRPSYIDDELAVADDAGEVTVFRELEVDVALFPLGARLPGVDRLVRGDVALVGGGGDAREVAQHAVKLVKCTSCCQSSKKRPFLVPPPIRCAPAPHLSIGTPGGKKVSPGSLIVAKSSRYHRTSHRPSLPCLRTNREEAF